MKKTTYDALYFLFLLCFIIVTANLTIIHRRNFYKKYNIKPFWKDPIQNIKAVLENPLPLVLALMSFVAIDKMLIYLGLTPRFIIG